MPRYMIYVSAEDGFEIEAQTEEDALELARQILEIDYVHNWHIDEVEEQIDGEVS